MTHLSVETRLKRKLVEQPSGCIEFMGSRDRHGYGMMRYNAKNQGAHRVAWTLTYGEIPDGLLVLHSCDNPPCCNPKHLRLGTMKDNMEDKIARGRHENQKKTHCAQGHPLSGENLRVSVTQRHCRICGRAAATRYYRKGRTEI